MDAEFKQDSLLDCGEKFHNENNELVNSEIFVVDCDQFGKCSDQGSDNACEEDRTSVRVCNTNKTAMKGVTRNFRKRVVKSVTRS